MNRRPYGFTDAFTLIELLVAIALLVVIVSVATTAFVQMLQASRRIQAGVAMDATAKTIHDRFAREVVAMHPCTAAWLRAPGGDVEFVFATSLAAPSDFPRGVVNTKNVNFRPAYTSTVWSRWFWDKEKQVLYVSQSSQMRVYVRDSSRWEPPISAKDVSFQSNTFLTVPRVCFETGMLSGANDVVGVLGDNRWIAKASARKPEDASDYDDYTDLIRRQRPIAYRCSALSIAVRPLDPSAPWVTANEATDPNWACLGNLVDGRMPTTPSTVGYRQDQRPSLIRLNLTLAVPLRGSNAAVSDADPSDVVMNTYEFSFSTPGLLTP